MVERGVAAASAMEVVAEAAAMLRGAAAREGGRSARPSRRHRLGRRLHATAIGGAPGLDQHVVMIGFVPARA